MGSAQVCDRAVVVNSSTNSQELSLPESHSVAVLCSVPTVWNIPQNYLISIKSQSPHLGKATEELIMLEKDNQEKVKKKEVVVLTGSSGCLGFHTLKLLISHDNQVGEIRCLDWRPMEPNKRRAIESELEKFHKNDGGETRAAPNSQNIGGVNTLHKSVKFICGDIRDINVVERALAGADCVLHCAAKIDIWLDSVDEQDGQELESINVGGTENLLKSAVRFGVGKFVHVSSFEAFTGYPTVYYATENTLPQPSALLFGPSGLTKRQAEEQVLKFSNNKLSQPARLSGLDSLNAIVIRFTLFYGEHDEYFISKLLGIAKFFGGKLQRFTNVWIRQQPIYVGNAAWALIRAKQQMDLDQSISGEDFNITDETAIGDPFEFFEQFAQARGMRVSKSSYPALPVFLLIWLFFAMRRFIGSLDVFGWFTQKKTRLQEAMEQDEERKSKQQQQAEKSKQIRDDDVDRKHNHADDDDEKSTASSAAFATSTAAQCKSIRWYHLIKPQIFFFMCNSLFLNRTKASLRLKYEPLFDQHESLERSIDWYKNHLEL